VRRDTVERGTQQTTPEDDDVADLIGLHEELAAVATAGRPLADVLGEITTIARQAMPGAESVSITLVRGDHPFTAAHDGQMALDADELQYARDYGPCVDAGRSGQLFLIDDMRTDDRWPDYTRHAAEHGVGSSLSVPLPFQSATLGALNNYSSRPHAFGDEDVELATMIAPWVAYAVNHAAEMASAADDTANMLAAMATRAGIEQAKGILMERHRLTADQAFTLLTKASQHTGLKLRAVAEQLVATGVLPGAR
jgi:GAF domain-containing protein